MILIGLLIIIGIAIWLVLLIYGVKLSSENNALGIVLLFLSLNILGLILGFALLYNSRNKLTDTEVEILQQT